MKYYILLWAAVLIGQLFIASIQIWYFQKDNPNIGYGKAVRLYISKESATFVVITMFTLLLMFVLPDWFDLKLTPTDLKTKAQLTKFESIQMKYRTYAAVYGTFAQLLAFLFYKGGKKAIQEYGQKKGIGDINKQD